MPSDGRSGQVLHSVCALDCPDPLELISSKNHDSMNSTFGNRKHVDAATSLLHLNQTDAVKRSIRSGDRVRVYNDRGSLTLRAGVNGAVQPGVARPLRPLE
ncbi:MAG: hypothetical protein M3N41_04940 [Acidobacteriota bacterium]|nr:hypothetical protein [Acidobacteriota bacterium]